MIEFFKPEEEKRVIEAIRAAERNTSGEVRVHLESKCKRAVMKEAIRTFRRLNMHKTKERNGVLLFIAPERKEFAIIGDKGINQLVPENFWDEEKKLLQEHFRKGAFADGICKAITEVGIKLKEHFPYREDDINELPDEISYGQN